MMYSKEDQIIKLEHEKLHDKIMVEPMEHVKTDEKEKAKPKVPVGEDGKAAHEPGKRDGQNSSGAQREQATFVDNNENEYSNDILTKIKRDRTNSISTIVNSNKSTPIRTRPAA